jgi:hypothetical protein
MKYWIFIVTNQETEDGPLTAREILTQRLSDKFWGLGEKTPNRRGLQKGDEVVFYAGAPWAAFAASATLNSDSFTLSDEQKKSYDHGKTFYHTNYGVLLDKVQMWETPRAIKDLIAALTFIKNREYWYTYFQGGVR